MSEAITLPLSRPITAHGEEVRQLALREPTGRDLRLCGTPYELSDTGSIRIDAAVTSKMIAMLAGIPPSSVDQLAAPDWQNAAMAVMGFFVERAPES